jgi:hypothetical protein
VDSQQEKIMRSHLIQKKLGMVVCTWHPSEAGSENRRMVDPGRLRDKHEILSQK